ncbi:MAG: hypothetical protein KF805_07465 [Phycisphaeraceae bacterium]|nr:hypothetical protein [Phycisphaeraceae bacterium]
MHRIKSSSTAAFSILLAAASHFAHAQCDPLWLPGEGVPGIPSTGAAPLAMKMWDPDGPGPLAPRLVVAGSFNAAGTAVVSNIAMWDGERWYPIGDGLKGEIYAIEVTEANELYVGGLLYGSGAAYFNSLAKWDGSKFVSVGGAVSGTVYALKSSPDGSLVVGGSFSAPGFPNAKILKWDGVNWSAIGQIAGTAVRCLTRLPNGNLVAGGQFSIAPGGQTSIALWDGTTWLRLGSSSGPVTALASSPNGTIYAGGSTTFSSSGHPSVSKLAQWTGTFWAPVGSGINGEVTALSIAPNGDLLAAGQIGAPPNYVYRGFGRFDGSSWSYAGPFDNSQTMFANAIFARPDGRVFVGASVPPDSQLFGGSAIAEWDSTGLRSMGRGIGGAVYALEALPNGDVVVAGTFDSVNSISASKIARTDGASWFSLGSGVSGSMQTPPTTQISPYVQTLLARSNGDLLAGGTFAFAGNTRANGIANWNNQSWSPLGTGIGGSFPYISALCEGPANDVFAAGSFDSVDGQSMRYVARWNGLVWEPATGNVVIGVQANISCMSIGSSDDIVIGGFFSVENVSAKHCVLQWDGSAWHTLGPGVSSSTSYPVAYALMRLPNGDILAGGDFTISGVPLAKNIARWNGTEWLPLGTGMNGSVSSLTLLTDGSVLAAGRFTTAGGVTTGPIARWDGTQWSRWLSQLGGTVSSLKVLPNGDVVVGSQDLLTLGQTVLGRFARWSANPAPLIATAPLAATLVANETLSLFSTAARGYSSISFQWSRETTPGSGVFENVANGAGGASIGGGTVSNASGQLPSPTDGTPATLTISNIKHSDAGLYRVTFWNSCGEAASIPAEIKVKAHIADINADGQVDDSDFVYFVTQYNLMLCADPDMPDACSADFNHDGFVDDADFVVFIPAYNTMVFP